MATPSTSSLMRTRPSPLQSPAQPGAVMGVSVGVGENPGSVSVGGAVGSSVSVAVGLPTDGHWPSVPLSPALLRGAGAPTAKSAALLFVLVCLTNAIPSGGAAAGCPRGALLPVKSPYATQSTLE